MKCTLVARPDLEDALNYTKDLASTLTNLGYTVDIEGVTARELEMEGTPFSSIEGDLIVVIGGDGSVLHTVHNLYKQIPLIGINFGTVGFLADLEPEEAPAFFATILEQGFVVRRRMRIDISINGDPAGEVLNEAFIVTSRPAKLLNFSIIVDGISAEKFRADGLLISTPTGSTAYAMSAGGPIVDPFVPGYLIVPLAPYHLSSRPHIISTERTLQIVVESDKPAELVLDGRVARTISAGDIITVEQSPDPALFIDTKRNFFLKVQQKLRQG